MRRDVTNQEFEAIPGAKRWHFNEEYGHPRIPDEKLHTRLQWFDDFEGHPGIPWAFMQGLSKLFETTNISIETEYDHDLSDMTPGSGPGISIVIEAEKS